MAMRNDGFAVLHDVRATRHDATVLDLPAHADAVMAVKALRSLLANDATVTTVAVHVNGQLRVVTSRRLLDRLGHTRGGNSDSASLPGETNQYIVLRFRCSRNPNHPTLAKIFADDRAATACSECGADMVRTA